MILEMADKEFTPLVTIAVVTYNQKLFLIETLDSILKQKTNYAYDIVVCDDASTDGTQDLCLLYQEKYPGKFRYKRLEKNSGITANCNQGVIYCKGKYLALIGGDDLFLDGKIQKQTQFMEDNPNVTISYHPVDIFDSSTNKTLFLTNQTNIDTPRNILELARVCIPGSVSVMVRKDALPSGGFDNRLPTVSDWLFYLEVAAKGNIGFLPETLARYRKHGNQASFRTYELLKESLLNLDLALEKIGSITGLETAIAQGKARYIRGEAFRQLSNNHRDVARMLLREANMYEYKIGTKLGLLISYIPYIPIVLKKSKALLKKIF